MSKKISNKAMRLSQDELSQMTAQGVERALKVRQEVGFELSPDEINEVSGGVNFNTTLLSKFHIAGGIRQNYIDRVGLSNVKTFGATGVGNPGSRQLT